MIFHKEVKVDEQLSHGRNHSAFVGFTSGS